MRGSILGLLAIFLCSSAFAVDQLPGNKYFSINTPVPPMAAADVDLMAWAEHDDAPPAPPEKYQRQHHFGIWIDLPNDTTCLTTRGLVLDRETKAPIEVYPEDPCYVSKGDWHDPYTGKNFTDAKQVQIDHLVPLKQAYIAGAYDWGWKKRCAYFNFLGNAYHLIPIEGSTNSKKSDKGPDQWMPPDSTYHCQYVANWLHVKAIWNLVMSEPETRAIQKVIRDNRCDPAMYKMSMDELSEQQAKIAEFENLCPDAPPEFDPAANH